MAGKVQATLEGVELRGRAIVVDTDVVPPRGPEQDDGTFRRHEEVHGGNVGLEALILPQSTA